MSNGATSPVSVSGDDALELAFSLSTKPSERRRKSGKIQENQFDEPAQPCEAVTVISKHQPRGFAAKKLPSDPARAALLHDLGTMTAMQLRERYRGEASTHRNMLARVKSCGAKVHPDFRLFADFLRCIGPKPTKKATLDRINNFDPEYAPGKVRWADKGTQNRNKGDSLIFTCPETGRYYTAGQLAQKQGLTPAAVRKRRRQGWADSEIICGLRATRRPSYQYRSPEPRATPVYRSPYRSAAEIMAQDTRESVEADRREGGVEPFICTPREMAEILSDTEFRLDEKWVRECEASFERHKLPAYWRSHGPYIDFFKLEPFQQEWVIKIDPGYRQKLEARQQLKEQI